MAIRQNGKWISDVVDETAILSDLGSACRNKLAENRGKVHWLDGSVSVADLVQGFEDEVVEFLDAVLEDGEATPDPASVMSEAADVANFAAMIAQKVSELFNPDWTAPGRNESTY